MQLTHIATTVLDKRYFRVKEDGTKENVHELLSRVASTIANEDKKYHKSDKEVAALERKFYDLMDKQDFMPNSPTFTGAGTKIGQLSACFVLPVADSLAEIYETMKHAALIHQTGGGTGFAFSRLRPGGDKVRASQGVASGPISFLKVYNASTEAIKQGGTRRGANMGILRVDHPDIMEFISAKEDVTQITNFNISVGITDPFMAALEAGTDYDLINPRTNEVFGQLSAKMLFEKLVDCAWKTGEPGIVFIDRMNRRNPNNHAEVIEATNPCGEQPLPPFGSCNLGSINLGNFVKHPYTDKAEVDWDRLAEITHLTTHFLDNVIDANKYPIEQLAEKARKDRRIGLGIMGFAELLVMLSLAYDSEEGVAMGNQLMTFIKAESTKESIRLAGVRGVYPEFPGSQWDKAGLKVRNATLTTVAPTGTISLFAAKPEQPCSGGCEPKFALVFMRNQAGAMMLDIDGQFEKVAKLEGWYSEELMKEVAEKGSCTDVAGVPDKWQKVFRVANEILPYWHVRMQAGFQGGEETDVLTQPLDAACSKTINFANNATTEDVRQAYDLAWKLGLKGITVYRDGSRFGQVLTAGTGEKKDEPKDAGKVNEAPKGPVLTPRPMEAHGKMFVIATHFGKVTVDVHMDDNDTPFEIICNVGAAGSDLMADAVGLGMTVSRILRLRSDVTVRERIEIIIETLKNISGSGSYGFGPNKVTSLPSAIARALEKFAAWYDKQQVKHEVAATVEVHDEAAEAHEHIAAPAGVTGDICPSCGNATFFQMEGCKKCIGCGHSQC